MFYIDHDLKTNELKLKVTRTTPSNPEKNWLPAYYFNICLLDDTVIGECDLRIGHNQNTYFGGNIGYKIYPKYRGNRYASKACTLLFKLAMKHDLEHLYITCTLDNIASNKTCEILNGVFVEIVKLPDDNDMVKDGIFDVNIYKFYLK